MEEIEMWLEDQKNFKGIDRPLVTLSYAQSLDGCIPRGFLDLRNLMDCLWGLGVKRLMVEGGDEVITSFLNGRLADRVVVTTSPVWLGGLGTVEYPLLRTGDTGAGFLSALENPTYQSYCLDMILYGRLGEGTL